jgi:release factor glutamine methyltransferase
MSHSKKVSSKMLYVQCVNALIPDYGEDEARQISKLLLLDLLDISFEKIMIDDEVHLEAGQHEGISEAMAQLKSHAPIQYVLGKAHFFGRDFFVNNHVLIPRQETEELINEVLVDNKRTGLHILDIGAGSGCIGITLALEMENARVSLLEVDAHALEVSRINARQNHLDLSFILEDILAISRLPEKYDIIVSNPPYVTEKEKRLMYPNVLLHEPAKALFVPDDDPLVFYKKIIILAKDALLPKGRLYFEINENYGWEVIKLCEQAGCTYVKLVQDINGKDRIVKVVFA